MLGRTDSDADGVLHTIFSGVIGEVDFWGGCLGLLVNGFLWSGDWDYAVIFDFVDTLWLKMYVKSFKINNTMNI